MAQAVALHRAADEHALDYRHQRMVGRHMAVRTFIAQACGVLAGLVFNFSLSRSLVFRKSG